MAQEWRNAKGSPVAILAGSSIVWLARISVVAATAEPWCPLETGLAAGGQEGEACRIHPRRRPSESRRGMRPGKGWRCRRSCGGSADERLTGSTGRWVQLMFSPAKGLTRCSFAGTRRGAPRKLTDAGRGPSSLPPIADPPPTLQCLRARRWDGRQAADRDATVAAAPPACAVQLPFPCPPRLPTRPPSSSSLSSPQGAPGDRLAPVMTSPPRRPTQNR